MLLPKAIDSFGIWMQFTGYYFYDIHDIFLKDGTLLKSMSPTENGWCIKGYDKASHLNYLDYCDNNNINGIYDSDIVAIKLLTDKEIKDRGLIWSTGEERLKRIKDSCGDGREYVIIDNNLLIKDHKIAQFVNDIRDIAVKYGATQQLREHVSKRTKKLLLNLMHKR